jgi:hypothetical protein
MAKTGLANYFYAIYASNAGTVTYSDGGEFAKAVSFKTSIEQTDINRDYANNEVSEEQPAKFKGGTVTITPDDFLPKVAAAVYGITAETLEGDDVALDFSAEMKPPFIGFGMIESGVKDGVEYFTARILPKIQMVPFDVSNETQGEEISWQHPELTANLYRDDTPKKRWKREGYFKDEEKAVEFVKTFLNIK